MLKERFKNTSTSQQLILLIIVTLLSWISISFIGTIAALPLYGIKTVTSPDAAMDNAGFLKYFQLIQSIGLFILPPFLFSWLCFPNPLRWLKISPSRILYFFLAIAIVLIAQPLINYLGVFNSHLSLPAYLTDIEHWMIDREKEAQNLTEIFLKTNGWTQIVFNMILIAVVPAIGEELLFRGALQGLLTKLFKNTHIAVWTAAFLFSAMHIQFFGFLPRMALGLLFGYMVAYSGSLWLAIAAHFTNNFTAYIIYQLYSDKASGINPLHAGTEYPNIFLVILSTLGVATLLILITKIPQPLTKDTE